MTMGGVNTLGIPDPSQKPPPPNPDYAAFEQMQVAGYMVEEVLVCPACHQENLIRLHLMVHKESGETEEFAHADRCYTCEPHVLMLPRLIAAAKMRARNVV